MTDLGTFHIKAVFQDGRGFIMNWETCDRFCYCNAHYSPLNAGEIPSPWEDKDDVIQTIRYMFLDGNYSCDCNRGAFIAYANQEDDPNLPCGDTIQLKELSVRCPNSNVWTIIK